MKILILQDDFPPQSLGGSGAVAYAAARGLLERGHEVRVVTATQDPTGAGEECYDGLSVLRLYSAYHERWRAYVSLCNPHAVRAVRQVLAEFKPDVVHAHNIHYRLSYASLKAAKQSGAKVFLTAHDAMLVDYGKPTLDAGSAFEQLAKFKLRYNPLRNVVIRWYLRYADRVFAVSAALQDMLKRHGIGNVSVLYNGIDAGQWSIGAATKSEFGLEGKKVMLFGGRLSSEKGGEQAVRMMPLILARVPNAALLVAGNKNAYGEVMLELARALGVEQSVVFSGWLSGNKLKAAYSASDIVLSLALYLDPLPTVVLEAMAAGKPVVATCFGGSKEMVEDGVTGSVVDPRDLSMLEQTCSSLLLDDALASSYGVAGRKRVLEHFSIQAHIDALVEAYRS